MAVDPALWDRLKVDAESGEGRTKLDDLCMELVRGGGNGKLLKMLNEIKRKMTTKMYGSIKALISKHVFEELIAYTKAARSKAKLYEQSVAVMHNFHFDDRFKLYKTVEIEPDEVELFSRCPLIFTASEAEAEEEEQAMGDADAGSEDTEIEPNFEEFNFPSEEMISVIEAMTTTFKLGTPSPRVFAFLLVFLRQHRYEPPRIPKEGVAHSIQYKDFDLFIPEYHAALNEMASEYACPSRYAATLARAACPFHAPGSRSCGARCRRHPAIVQYQRDIQYVPVQPPEEVDDGKRKRKRAAPRATAETNPFAP